MINNGAMIERRINFWGTGYSLGRGVGGSAGLIKYVSLDTSGADAASRWCSF